MPNMGSDQHSIVVLRVKRPRNASPIDDLVVKGQCKRRALSGVRGASECLSRFSMNENAGPNMISQVFQRVDTLSCENAQELDLPDRLRDRINSLNNDGLEIARRNPSTKRSICTSSDRVNRLNEIDNSRFQFFDIDPVSEGPGSKSRYEQLMRRYQLDNHEEDATEYVWDLFVYNGKTLTSTSSDRVCIDVGEGIDLNSGLHDALVFDEYADSAYDSEDSNAADNPDFSYPEDESDSDDDYGYSDDDCLSDPYNNDDDLDAIDDYDQS